MFGFAGDWLKEKRFHEEQKNGYKRLLLGKEGSSESVVFYFYLQNFFQKTSFGNGGGAIVRCHHYLKVL